MVERDGWYLMSTTGSHRKFRHPTKPGRVIIAGRPGKELNRKTWSTIRKQAGLKRGTP